MQTRMREVPSCSIDYFAVDGIRACERDTNTRVTTRKRSGQQLLHERSTGLFPLKVYGVAVKS